MQSSGVRSTITDPSDTYNRTIRDRASESLQELHQTFNSPYPMASPLKTSSPFSKQYSPQTTRSMPRDSSPDTDNTAAYRLKSLLGHNVTPARSTAATLPSPRSRITPFQSPSRAPPLTGHRDLSLPVTTPGGGVKDSGGPCVEDLLPVINSQSTYLQQLEGENRFCKEELGSLKLRIQNVTDENSRLHEELKEAVVKTVLREEQFTQDTVDDKDTSGQDASMDKHDGFGRFGQELKKMKALHDAKSKRLEAQLSYSREQLEKFEKECDDLRGKLRMSESANLLSREDSIIQDGLCIRCAQYEAVLPNTHASPNGKAMEKITKERDDLMNTLTTMKATMDDMKHRESDSYEQVKHSVNMVEQAQLEKTQALVQKEQVSEDLEKLQHRMSDLISEHQDKLHKERQLTRKECEEQIDQLNKKIADLSQELVSSQGLMDRITREKVSLMSELEQAKNQIIQHEQDVGKVSQDIKLSTATAKVQRDEAFRQMDRLRHTLDQQIRDKEQEASRNKKELRDVRRRLEAAERDSTGSKEECIKLTEKLNAVEKEASHLRVVRDTLEKGKHEEIKSVSRRAKQKEEELQQTLYELVNKHTITVTELEDILGSQNTLINKLRDEGKVLTGQLDRVSEKYRTEVRRLRQTNSEVNFKSERVSLQLAQMEAEVVEHGKTHHKMRSRLQQLEDHATRSGKQVYSLLQKQTSLLQERQTLAKEVEFLRVQLKGTPLGQHPSGASSRRQNNAELDPTPVRQRKGSSGTDLDLTPQSETRRQRLQFI